MTRLASRIAGVTFIALAATAGAAQASTRVFVQIGAPAPVVVASPPPPVAVAAPVRVAPYGYGYVWRPAYYGWTGYSYRIVPGTWVRPPYPRAVWVAPSWRRGPRGGYYVRGYWRR